MKSRSGLPLSGTVTHSVVQRRKNSIVWYGNFLLENDPNYLHLDRPEFSTRFLKENIDIFLNILGSF